MKVSYHIHDIGKRFINKDIGNSSHKGENIAVDRISYKDSKVEYFDCSVMSSDGFAFLDMEIKLNEPLNDRLEVSGDNVMMTFLYNVSDIKEDFDRIKYSGGDYTHNLLYSPRYSGICRMPANIPLKMLIVVLSKEFYFKLIPSSADIHKDFSGSIMKSEACSLSERNLPLTAEIQEIISKIKMYNRLGSMKGLYIKNKIEELLLLQHEMKNRRESLDNKNLGIGENDIPKLEQAKKILDMDFKEAPSLPELSRMVYLNEFKLKKGFKTYFGMTIKSYITRLRMGHAMKLLSCNDCLISDVADQCGYNGLIQFSAAFKKFYGCSPKCIQCNSCEYGNNCLLNKAQ